MTDTVGGPIEVDKSELDEVLLGYFKLIETYNEVVKENEALRERLCSLENKHADLRKVCEILSDTNMKMLGDLLVTATSRERVLNTMKPGEQWAERTMTQFDKTSARSQTDYTKIVPELFTEGFNEL